MRENSHYSNVIDNCLFSLCCTVFLNFYLELFNSNEEDKENKWVFQLWMSLFHLMSFISHAA